MNQPPRIYFYCRDNSFAYQDDVVVLADGLRQLGWEIHGNCNYWRTSLVADSWLVRHDPAVRPEHCDIVAVSYIWPRWHDNEFRILEQPLPADLFAPGRRYRTAYLDLDDGYRTMSWRPEYRQFDAIFRAKYNVRCFHPSNHHPWVLGINARMLEFTAGAPPWSQRQPELLVNFNASHTYVHGARAKAGPPLIRAAQSSFAINDRRDDLKQVPADPYDRLMWEQTQKRHSRSYYERLKSAQAVAAICGELIPATPFEPDYLVGGRRAKLRRLLHDAVSVLDPRPPRLIQWDSWRFWEALSAGCLVFNFDLPYYGIRLPVMPENFVHYIGLRLDNMDEVFARLKRDPDLAPRIAAAGHAWAMQNYTPVALARRFLSTLQP